MSRPRRKGTPHKGWKKAAQSSHQPPDERCAKCDYPRAEHSYNGACYGLCGEFVSPLPSTHLDTPGEVG